MHFSAMETTQDGYRWAVGSYRVQVTVQDPEGDVLERARVAELLTDQGRWAIASATRGQGPELRLPDADLEEAVRLCGRVAVVLGADIHADLAGALRGVPVGVLVAWTTAAEVGHRGGVSTREGVPVTGEQTARAWELIETVIKAAEWINDYPEEDGELLGALRAR